VVQLVSLALLVWLAPPVSAVPSGPLVAVV